jgi:hypothetical protein
MPGLAHEAATKLFHDNHDLAPYLVASLRIQVSGGTASIGDSNVSLPDSGLNAQGISTVERRADVITIMRDGDRDPRQAIVTEIQSTPPTLAKWWTWMAYIALAGRRYLCLVTLLVVAPHATSSWTSSPGRTAAFARTTLGLSLS